MLLSCCYYDQISWLIWGVVFVNKGNDLIIKVWYITRKYNIIINDNTKSGSPRAWVNFGLSLMIKLLLWVESQLSFSLHSIIIIIIIIFELSKIEVNHGDLLINQCRSSSNMAASLHPSNKNISECLLNSIQLNAAAKLAIFVFFFFFHFEAAATLHTNVCNRHEIISVGFWFRNQTGVDKCT